MAKALFLKASTNKCDESSIDDSLDIVFDKLYEVKPFYGIQRHTVTKSCCPINYINVFG